MASSISIEIPNITGRETDYITDEFNINNYTFHFDFFSLSRET